MDLVVRNGSLITGDGKTCHNRAAVYVRHGWIAGVDAEETARRLRETIDAAGGIVIPGLINAHAHGCIRGPSAIWRRAASISASSGRSKISARSAGRASPTNDIFWRPLGSPLETAETATTSDLKRARIIALSRSNLSYTEKYFFEQLRKHGLLDQVAYSCDDTLSWVSLVAAGIGVGFVPDGRRIRPTGRFAFGQWREWIFRSAWGSPGTRKTPPRTLKSSWKSPALSHRSRGRVNPPACILKGPARPLRAGAWSVGSRTRPWQDELGVVSAFYWRDALMLLPRSELRVLRAALGCPR